MTVTHVICQWAPFIQYDPLLFFDFCVLRYSGQILLINNIHINYSPLQKIRLLNQFFVNLSLCIVQLIISSNYITGFVCVWMSFLYHTKEQKKNTHMTFFIPSVLIRFYYYVPVLTSILSDSEEIKIFYTTSQRTFKRCRHLYSFWLYYYYIVSFRDLILFFSLYEKRNRKQKINVFCLDVDVENVKSSKVSNMSTKQ